MKSSVETLTEVRTNLNQLTKSRMTRTIFWSTEGNDIYRHHVEPRVQLYVPKEEAFPIPLKYIDVTRSTHTTLDVLHESRVDDYWNIDVNRILSHSWTAFTKFQILNEKPPEGNLRSGEAAYKNSSNHQTLVFVARKLVRYVESRSTKGKQQWALEKLKLDSARKLRGFYCIDRDDKEFKEIH